MVVGPTAVGKSMVAYRLAEWLRTEVLSVDSRKMYKELKIGVARPSEEMLARIRHHFIGHYTIREEVSAGRFREDATQCLQKRFKVHAQIIGAGGSGFYVQALCDGLPALPVIPSALRKKWRDIAKKGGRRALVQFLEEKDPHYLHSADRFNTQRLVHAAEVIEASGRQYSDFLVEKKAPPPFSTLSIGLHVEKKCLHQMIDARVDRMMDEGLLQEIHALSSLRTCNLLWNTIGYKEFFAHLEGKISLQAAIALFKQHTKQYAKRQHTWFKKDGKIRWFHPEALPEMQRYLKEKITNKSYVSSY